MRFIFQNIYRNDGMARVMIMPAPGSTGSVTMYRLTDDTLEWSHSVPMLESDELDHVLDAYTDLIKKRWQEHSDTYTLDSPSYAATA